MEDIVPELLKKIRSEFISAIGQSSELKDIEEKIAKGTATYAEANQYAVEAGNILARAYKNNISSEILPDGKMYYNIADRVIGTTMKEDYDLISDVSMRIQKDLNEAAGIGLNAVAPGMNEDRISGIINRVSAAENYDDVAWILQEPVVNYSQSIVDETIKANAEFHAKAGLTAKIVRRLAGGCCEWCSHLAGTYSYPDVPKDVYRRHLNCHCTVEYTPAKGHKSQNVWTKKWKSTDEKDIIESRKKVGLKESHNLVLKKGTDVTTEYEHQKFPGQGKITYGDGYDELLHKDEIEFAQWLHNRLGGDITLVNEANIQDVKTPDYIWNGKYWDLKTTSTAKSANSALRHGLKQIKNNPGGVILNYQNMDVNLQDVVNEVENRMRQSKRDLCQVDVMIVFNQEIAKIIRY